MQKLICDDEELDNQNQYGDEDYFEDDDVDGGDMCEDDDEYDDVPDYFEEDIDE